MRKLLSRGMNIFLAHVAINTGFIYFAINFISAENFYDIKKYLTLYFLMNFVSLLIANNSLTRTKIFLAISSIFLGVMQMLEFDILRTYINSQFCLIYAFSAIMCCGPFRALKNSEAENYLKFISIISPYIMFLLIDNYISSKDIIYVYCQVTIFVNFLIMISRKEEISFGFLAEIFSVYLIMLHAHEIIDQTLTYEIILLLFGFNLFYGYFMEILDLEEYKKVIEYTISFIPLILHQGFFEYSATIFLLIIISTGKSFFGLKYYIDFDYAYLKTSYKNFINPNFGIALPRIEGRIPRLSLSFAISIFFITIYFLAFI